MQKIRMVLLLVLVGMGLLAPSPGVAEQVRMKDGTELDALMVRKDSERVMLVLSRFDVESIDGEVLPEPVIGGSPAPSFTAADLKGTPHTLPYKEGTATLVKFWATWCPYCRGDIPVVTEWAEQYEEKGLRFLTVSTDEDLDALQAFVATQEVAYSVIPAMKVMEEGGPNLPQLFEASGVPVYFLIGKDGRVIERITGAIVQRREEVEQKLRAALGLPALDTATN